MGCSFSLCLILYLSVLSRCQRKTSRVENCCTARKVIAKQYLLLAVTTKLQLGWLKEVSEKGDISQKANYYDSSFLKKF